MPIVAIDSGSSVLKCLTAQHRDSFPAAARALTSCAEHGGDTLLVDGVPYVVGDSAVRTCLDPRGWEPHVQGGFHGSLLQYVQMCYAMQRLGVQGDCDGLVVSLPYAESQQEAIRALLRGRPRYAWTDPEQEHDYEACFGEVRVLPQGVGAMVRFECDHPERPEALVLVDIGSCTIDVIAMRYSAERGHYLYLHERSQSRRTLSVTHFYRHWLGRLRNLDGCQDLTRGYHALMDLVVHERPLELSYQGRKVDLTTSLAATKQWFTEALVDALRADIGGALLDEVDQVVLTGGGAQLVAAPEALLGGRVVVLDQWANVEGQYLEALGRSAEAYEAIVRSHQAMAAAS